MSDEFIKTYDISDEELKYLLNNSRSFDALFNIIKDNPSILSRNAKRLGNVMKKNSKLLKMNLPSFAFDKYKKKDPLFSDRIHRIMERNKLVLRENINSVYGKELSDEEIKHFSCEDIIDFLTEYEKTSEASAVDLELFFIQCKLNDIEFSEDIVKKVKSKWNEYSGISDEIEDDKKENQESQLEKKKITKSKKTVSPQEKAAKQKAAEKMKKVENEEIEKKDNNPVEEITQSINAEEKIIEHDNKSIESKEEKKTEIIISKEKKMKKYYVGSINVKGNYYNFTPIGQVNGENFEVFNELEVESLLPKSAKLNINLYYNFWDEQSGKFVSQFHDGQLILIDYDVDEMEENRDADMNLNPTGYKIPFEEGFKNGRIKLMSDVGFYSIKDKSVLVEDICSKNGVKIADEDLIEGEKIFVRLDKDYLAGPYKVEFKPTYNSFVIKTDTITNKYVLKGYNISDCKKVIFEKIFTSNWNEQKEWTFYRIKNDAQISIKDVISNATLLESFGSILEKQGEETLKTGQLSTIADKYRDDIFSGEGISEEIKNNRFERIKELLTTEDERQTEFNGILELVSNVLTNNTNNEKFSTIIETILSKDDFIDKLQNVQIVREKIENLRQELDSLQQERLRLQAQVDNISNEKQKEDNNDFNSSDETLDELLKKKSDVYKELCDKLDVAEEIESLKELCEKYKKELDYYESHKDRLTEANKTLEAEFVEMVNEHSKKIAEISFDGFMSSKMLQAATEWEESQNNELQNEIVDKMNSIEASNLNGEDLVKYLVSTIQIERPQYDRNFIVNMLTCISQGFLTVFSGAPGCGKTSICNITGKVFGLKNTSDSSDNMNRYLTVSVERGWTSKRDFIGYYNPLTKAFEESNREVFEGLRLLNIEYKKELKKYPFMILLDEANLSPMEYYWADFMNVCDDLKDNHSINLGNNNIFDIPETLHFLATINNDHTTEVLSPRLIDRAWIITLPENRMLEKAGTISDVDIRLVSWESLKDTFVYSGDEYISFSNVIQKIFMELKDLLARENMYISARVEIIIKKYWIVASSLMEEDEMGTSASVVALDYAISQKILPRISGNGEEYLNWLKSFKEFAGKNNLSISEGIIDRIIAQGNRQMKFYQFFN